MIETVADPGEMRRLEGAWNDLARRSRSPLLHHEWFVSCAEAFCGAGGLRLILKRQRGGEISAAAPLILLQHRGLPRLEILGASVLGEPGGFLYADEESLFDLVDAVFRMGKPILLSRLGSEASEVSVLKRLQRVTLRIKLDSGGGTPYVPVSGSWAQFEKRISSRHRYDLRRARKRAEEFGDIEITMLNPETGSLQSNLVEFYRVEAAGWKGRDGTAILADARLKVFFDLYCARACGAGRLRLCFLRLGGKLAAGLLAVEDYNRFWVLKIGYDESFSRCSPGVLLIDETIRYAFDRGLDSYEFLGSDAPWIHTWTREVRPCVSVRAYPLTVHSFVKLGLDTMCSLGGSIRRWGAGRGNERPL